MSADDPRVTRLELFAWVGEDELGSGRIGIKQALVLNDLGESVPGFMLPLVSVDRVKLERLSEHMNRQARDYGKKIRLCRFTFAGIVTTTVNGT